MLLGRRRGGSGSGRTGLRLGAAETGLLLSGALLAGNSGALTTAGAANSDVGAARAGGTGFSASLKSDLRQAGFTVNPGYPLLYAKDGAKKCANYTYPALKNCFGANPIPYVIAIVKSWPDEYVEPRAITTFGAVRSGYSPIYRLHRREAIVIYGTMPPPGRYFGLQTYLWSQPGHWKATDYDAWANDPRRPWPLQYQFETMPPTQREVGRVWSFSALGDIVNSVVVQRQSGYPFGEKRYFIITPSATTDRAVRRALNARGVPDRLIFTEQVPSRDKYGPIGPLGMGKQAVDFVTTFRYAVPASADAAAEWRRELPLEVMRVRAPASAGPLRRYGALRYERHTARSETHLAGDLQSLVGAVCEHTTNASGLRSTDCAQTPPAAYVLPSLNEELGWVGPYCRKIGMSCTGDNNDAAIFWGKPLPIDSGEVYAVVDTLATETGNATYVGLSTYNASTFAGPTNTLDTSLDGSADRYRSTVANTDKFFVHYFARDCTPLTDVLGDRPLDCTEITDQMVPRGTDANAVGHASLRGMLMVALRNYIVPGTQRAADASKLLPPRILTFTP
jgi:hypothetical protein